MAFSNKFRSMAMGAAALTAVFAGTTGEAEARGNYYCNGAQYDRSFQTSASQKQLFDYQTGCVATVNTNNGSATTRVLNEAQFYNAMNAAERRQDNFFRSQWQRSHRPQGHRNNGLGDASRTLQDINRAVRSADQLMRSLERLGR